MSPFFGRKKRGGKGEVHSETGETQYMPTVQLVGCTVKTDTTDIQAVDSDYTKVIRQEMQEERKTKEARDEPKPIARETFV
jgi:hypothetical protein